MTKDPNNRDVIENFKLISLNNEDLKSLAKRLVLIMDKLVGEEKICTIQNMTIHNNPHILRYII